MKIISALMKKIRGSHEKKVLVENFFSLSFLQTANYIFPFITLPYLVRVLGTEKYGLIVFAQVIIQYFVIFINYGFDLSATRQISTNRENLQKISEIFSTVMFIKLIFMISSFLIIAVLIFAIPKFRNEWLLYLFTFAITLGNVLFPVWLFQGMEKMKYIAFLNIFSKLIFTVLIFTFINRISHYIYVPLINSLSFIITGLMGFMISMNVFKVRIVAIPYKKIFLSIKDGFGLFLSRISSRGYSITNTFLIGIFFGNTFVTYYYIADKIILTVLALWRPLVQTIYPYLSRDFRPSFFRKILYLSLFASLGVGLIIYLLSNVFSILIYGSYIKIFSEVLNYLTILIPISAFYVLLGAPLLLALGFKREFANSITYGFVIHLSLLLIYFSFFKISLIAFAIILILSKMFVLSIRIFYVYKRGYIRYIV